MATREEIVSALSQGAKFTQSYDGSATGCWADLLVKEAGDTRLEYRVGPYTDPAKVLKEIQAILTEAGVG